MKPIRLWKTIRAWRPSTPPPCAEELPQGLTPETASRPLEETGSMATASKPCPAPDVPRLPVLISTATSRLAHATRKRLERLLRYAARPAVALERLSRLPDGRLVYRLKRMW